MPFNIGDVVRLKSRGPYMTIIKLPDADATNNESQTHYKCIWWNDNKYETHSFLEEALERVPESLIG